MAPSSVVEPDGPGLSKTPLFATIGAQLISKDHPDHHGQVRTMKIVKKAKRRVTEVTLGIHIDGGPTRLDRVLDGSRAEL
jgi:hypothetical protein